MRTTRPIACSQKLMALLNRAIIKCSYNSMKGASSPSRIRNVDPRPSRSGPRRSNDGHSSPLPRSRRFDRRHRSEAPPGRYRHHSRSVRRHDRKVWPSKKNSIATARSPQPPWERRPRTRHQTYACNRGAWKYGVRQLLADKVAGNLSGVWLLAPELLRLGAWDLVCDWTGQRPERVGPRLALQII